MSSNLRTAKRIVDRILIRLRRVIQERGFTQLEVEEVLGWGRGYISQLVTRRKAVRIEQILLILNIINVTPEDFFGEIFLLGNRAATRRRAHRPVSVLDAAGSMDDDLYRIKLLYDALVSVLTRKGLLDAASLERAIERAKRHPDGHPMS